MSLPIEAYLTSIQRQIENHSSILCISPTGSGKSTVLPSRLLEYSNQKIWLLQPRQAAAKMVAKRIAELSNVKLGEEVGYHVRFENKTSETTQLTVMTQGMFVQHLHLDPYIEDVEIVILDEFHERSLEVDLSLAWLRELQGIRDDLKIIILSATLDPLPLQDYFGEDLYTFQIEGRSFPITIDYLTEPAKNIIQEGCKHIKNLCERDDFDGDILFFLPGVREIEQGISIIQQNKNISSRQIFALHGSMSPKEQETVIYHPETKIILATNIAETSLTLPNVTYVIDSGLHRVAYDQEGITHLKTEWISTDSADQRAGRAGRVCAGNCLRLWTKSDQHRRLPSRMPEIEKRDLSLAVAQVQLWGSTFQELPWLTKPPIKHVQQAMDFCEHLGVFDKGSITELGKDILKIPLPMPISKMLLLAKERGVLGRCLDLAVLLTENQHSRQDTDLYDILQQFRKSPQTFPNRVQQSRRQIQQIIRGADGDWNDWHQVWLCFGIAFPSRVGRWLDKRRGNKIKMADGKWAFASGGFLGKQNTDSSEYLLALSLYQGEKNKLYVQEVVAFDIEELPLQERDVHFFDEEKGQVRRALQKYFGKLVIHEMPLSVEITQCSDILRDYAHRYPERCLNISKKAQHLLDRIRYAQRKKPDFAEGIKSCTELIDEICIGKKSVTELLETELYDYLRTKMSWEDQQWLERTYPDTISLPKGKTAQIHYPEHGIPFLAERIQNLFGLHTTPLIDGEMIMVHLLAPNGRAQQVTQDLDSFWNKTYAEVRRELRGRYPKHDWPDPKDL